MMPNEEACIQNAETIQRDIDILYAMREDEYPNLYYALFSHKGTLIKHLLQVFDFMQEYRYPVEIDRSGRGYWKIPQAEMIKRHGGKASTWQSHFIFLRSAGLLCGTVPNERTRLKRLRMAYETARRYNIDAPIFYSPVPFTPDVLKHADTIAGAFRNAGITLSKITKTQAIKVLGEDTANILYMDRRTVPPAEQALKTHLKSVFKAVIEKQGYLYLSTVEDEIRLFLRANKDIAYYRAGSKVLDRMKETCIELGYRYAPPTRKQRQLFSLQDSRWIITPLDTEHIQERHYTEH